MTRINTNVSSLTAQKSLARSNIQLQEALTRLSTGLRINVGKDDPAGLIASEVLRSDIISTQKAVSNSQRANQMIATADSSLGQVSALLNDIRGLITEAANTGAMSEEQIAANQLQIDSSLDAINRVAQTTTFQGRRLLDGSLDFNTEGSTNFVQLTDLTIQQATLAAGADLAVSTTVTAAATQAQVNITNVPTATDPINATITFGMVNPEALATSGTINMANSTLTIAAVTARPFAGDAGNLHVRFTAVDAGITAPAKVVVAGDTMTITAKAITTTWTEIHAAIETLNGDSSGFATGDFAAVVGTGAGVWAVGDAAVQGEMIGGRDAGTATVRVTADAAGVNTKTVTLTEGALVVNDASAEFDVNGNIVVNLDADGTVSHARIAEVINDLAGYTAELITTTGDTNYVGSLDDAPGVATLANGALGSGGLAQAAVFSVAGLTGSQVFQFNAGASITQMKAAVDALSEATGVGATIAGTTLQLKSTDYGSKAFVDVRVISEAAGGTITQSVGQGMRDEGTDIEGRVNGIEANGVGNTLSINTPTLGMEAVVSAGFTGSIAFNITGGGAQFQLGPDVVSNQQSRIGIQSLDTASMGGSTGRLYELAAGGSAQLATDATRAAAIADEAITKVTGLRGRLGAFQKTTLDVNINALNDTLENLADAESSIRDADFAAETAKLTRAQILVQSGMAVLAIANQRPQSVLGLLR
jgi:flagellin